MWEQGSITPFSNEYILQQAKQDKEIKELVDNQMRILRKKYDKLMRERLNKSYEKYIITK